MMTYKLKKIVAGSIVSLDTRGMQLAPVPDKLLKGDVMVICKKESMLIKKGTKPLLYRKFDDKFGRKEGYTLAYFEWKPQHHVEQIQRNTNHL